MSETTYETFELRIQPGPNTLYEALVTRSLAGDARAEFALPFADAELKAFLWQTLGATRTTRLVTQAGPAMDVKDFGCRLYQAVFGDAVDDCLMLSLQEAKRLGSGLRLRLRIDDRLPALADLPWEYLFAPKLDHFLALSDDTPLVRYLEVRQAALLQPVQPPLVVLAVVSNPSDVKPLAVDKEWHNLQESVSGLGDRQIRLERIAATWPALQARLRNGPAHVVHFIGHGYFDAAAAQGHGEGGVLFEDETGRASLISAERFKVLLFDQSDLRLVFLNACEGAASGRSDSFAGVAQQLVEQGVPAVLAMQFPISDRAAIALSREFYSALAGGYPMDAAVVAARKAVFGLADSPEWGTPVLFSRSEDNRLIELPQGDRRPEIETKSFEPETVFIPGGPFPMGSDDPATPAWEQSQGPVDLSDFRIGRYPVTNRQYAAFLRNKKDQAAPPGYFNREPPPLVLDHPVTSVSWHDALAYCAWLSAETGRRYTLPSEAEWEKAGCWRESGEWRVESGGWRKRKRQYPWGDEWVECRCNAAGSGTTAVTAHPAGASAYGVQDLLGNVQEWTRSLWGSQVTPPEFGYPYDPDDGREVTDPSKLPAQARLVHRGGSFKSAPAELRCSARGNALPDSKIAWRGFRVAMEI